MEFVGHPLVDLARPTQERAAFLTEYGLAADMRTVALLPGSRPNEIERIAPELERIAQAEDVSGIAYV